MRNVIIRKIRYLSTYIIIYDIPAKYSAEIYKFIQVIHRWITQVALKIELYLPLNDTVHLFRRIIKKEKKKEL